MPCGNPNCSCGSSCSCGDDCKCGRTVLSFSENATTSKTIIAGVAPLKTYRLAQNCDSFGFDK